MKKLLLAVLFGLIPLVALAQAMFGATPTSGHGLCANANLQLVNCDSLVVPPPLNGTTKFTASGCSNGTTVGGATAGKFTLGANTCTVVITMNGATGLTAPNGWTCNASDQTSGLIAIETSSSTQTTASLNIPVTAGATDVISFQCAWY